MSQNGRPRLNLIFDADDTLWDSNLHFLEAQAAFLKMLSRAGHTDQARIHASIRTHELAIIAEIGYGRRPYVMALHRVVEEILHPEVHSVARAEVEEIGDALMERHCEVLPGVAATLEYLAPRHRLLLFTKGQPAEQMWKLERSGLRGFFSRIGIPLEKDTAAYTRLLAQAALDPQYTVMIGNSPRSDINPALRAGFRAAVYIPHPQTWEMEHEELADDERIIVLPAFQHLREMF
jgi:putative hydrolase of the HAD superfamily